MGGFTGAFGKGGLHHFTLGVEGILCDALNILRSFGDTLGFNRGRQAFTSQGEKVRVKTLHFGVELLWVWRLYTHLLTARTVTDSSNTINILTTN